MTTAKIKENPPFADKAEADEIAAFHTAMDGDVLIAPDRKKSLEFAAQATIWPVKKKISARLSELDLAKLKSRAMSKGIPYQTLLASIVHQYVEGTLIEKP